MVQPNIGESGSKSAARALELVLPKAQINFQDRDQLCGSKTSSANLYIKLFKTQLFSSLPVSISFMECSKLGNVNIGYY